MKIIYWVHEPIKLMKNTRKLFAIDLIKRRKSEAMQAVSIASPEDNVETK